MKSELTGQSDVIHLTGEPQAPQRKIVKRQAAPVRSDPQNPTINLSDYQKRLLEEINKRPEIMKLFKVIFQEYPTRINLEYRLTSPHATRRQKMQGQKVALERLRIEAFIEEQVCKLAGININEIAAENTEKPEVTDKELQAAMEEEAVVQAVAEVEAEAKKTTKKKTTKKKTSKKS